MAYLFNTDEDISEMLAAIGANSIESLFSSIPESCRFTGELDIPEALTEMALTNRLSQLSSKNLGAYSSVCFLGGGAYDHFIPAVVNEIAGRGEFYTSYTPYQPEVSQGNLQVMFEYETLICQLTGMDVSNASLYDGATSMVEGVLLSLSGKPDGTQVVVPESLHPEYRQTLETYLLWTPYRMVTVPCPDGQLDLDAWKAAMANEVGCVVLSQPNFFGLVEDLNEAVASAKAVGATVVAVVDFISLGILAPPAEWGADIVVGEGQSLGNPLQFGGPYLGIMACRESFVRRMPGRIAGQTEDKRGSRCWVLTLQTREQHIRRDKATSNICTNQGLFALRAAIYLSLLGPQGLKETAEQCAWKTAYLAQALASSDRFEVRFAGAPWREIVVRDKQAEVAKLIEQGLERRIHVGLDLGRWYPELSDCLLIAVTEKRTKAEIDQLLNVLNQSSVKELNHA